MEQPVNRQMQQADGKPASSPGADAEQDNQRGVKRGLPASAPAPAAILPVEEQRATKRVRRDRGSTAKDRISKIPPCVVGKRSSIYRGVTRHRWTGRYEAHLWDKSTWNQSQNKKGKQVYLGAYDEEEAAARAYDLAALKYWGPGTIINFPVTDYARDVEEMQSVSREEYLASLRRKSSGFSRGVSKYRGVARHHHNGRWEARIGRVFGNKYLYLGTYSTQEEAAAAYDMAAIQHRGLNAVTNFDLSHYIKWLRPRSSGAGCEDGEEPAQKQSTSTSAAAAAASAASELQESQSQSGPDEEQPSRMWPGQASEPYQFPSLGMSNVGSRAGAGQQRVAAAQAPTALGLLWQSNMFKQMLEKAAVNAHSPADGQPEAEQEQEELEVEGEADGLPIPMLPGLEEEPPPGLSFEEGQGEVAYQDLSFFSDSQELELGLAGSFWSSLPLHNPRSPITV